ncbi:MAG: KpsF/GutQ family sugar-phosphate isomerase [Proteobacteria bacterium]|nr:KpsF/GutQ family sugar-phosphate isomerase [Pseudomonadota bacterium]MBU4470114.1 KpsF/GutQ family sugar-phosphate isomerase [Pseudomonadota bacterium]MCG2750288.1 KpsF/GutQ family sugar-phosphate isomerase [Desulfobacteraceae bacterium]
MIIEQAAEVLRIEAQGILDLIDRLGEEFTAAVEAIYNCPQRVVISGIGKSGLVGRKIVATLNSTGTQSIFLHPVEAMHGDLGIVSKEDVFLALSYTGETAEMNALIPSIHSLGCTIIALTGNPKSTLAKISDIVIDVGVKKEACSLGAPTASTTALLAMGDALAVVLIQKKRFQSSDFKKVHPGGNLGQRLSSCVSDLMVTGDSVPLAFENQAMEEIIATIDRINRGAVFIVTRDFSLKGIVTDGDIRRQLVKKKNVLDLSLAQIMTQNPLTVRPESPTYDALNIMEQHQITILPVTELSGKVQGVLHLHDILGNGEFKFNGS